MAYPPPSAIFWATALADTFASARPKTLANTYETVFVHITPSLVESPSYGVVVHHVLHAGGDCLLKYKEANVPVVPKLMPRREGQVPQHVRPRLKGNETCLVITRD